MAVIGTPVTGSNVSADTIAAAIRLIALPPIPNAVPGTEAATINSLLAALRTLGLIKS